MLEIRLLHSQVRDQNLILEEKVKMRTRELEETRQEVVLRLGRAAEYRDNETGMHVIRMSRLSAKLAKEIGLTDEACQLMLQASPMHDVGKIGIPDEILLKPGKLNEKEWKIMKKHPDLVDIFKRALPEMIRIVKELPGEDSADVLKVYRKNGSNKWPQKSLSSIR